MYWYPYIILHYYITLYIYNPHVRNSVFHYFMLLSWVIQNIMHRRMQHTLYFEYTGEYYVYIVKIYFTNSGSVYAWAVM